MKNASLLGLLAVVALGPVPLAGQATLEKDNPLSQVLFEPELIMQHRRAVRLTDEQRDAITRLIEELQGRVVGLQWQLLDEMQALTEILEGPRVDLDRAMDRMGEVLGIESEIKRRHLELLIRIKNVLTREQQAELTRLRDRGAGNDP
jgi:Spy/CpxP family protein refolding chaperone